MSCFLICLSWFRSYSLPVRDRTGRKWEFVIKSWANGTENRRVYVLEQTGEFLKVLCQVLSCIHCMLFDTFCFSSSKVVVQELQYSCRGAGCSAAYAHALALCLPA